MDGSISFQELIVGGGFITIVGFAIATYNKVTAVKEENNAKVDRAYQRIDEVKTDLKKEMVDERVCSVVHKAVDARLGNIEKTTECIQKIKAGIDLLLKKNGLETKD